jgi:hypothetical protein
LYNENTLSEGSSDGLLLSDQSIEYLERIRSMMIAHLVEKNLKVPVPIDAQPMTLGLLMLSSKGVNEEYPELGIVASARALILVHYLHEVMQTEWKTMTAEWKQQILKIARAKAQAQEISDDETDHIALDIITKINKICTLHDMQAGLLSQLLHPKSLRAQIGLTNVTTKKNILEGLRDLMTAQGMDVSFAIKL